MTKLKVTERVGRISTSPSAVASQRARELQAEGHSILALSAGEPDFQTPPHVIEAAHKAMLDGETKYTSIAGTPGPERGGAREVPARKRPRLRA